MTTRSVALDDLPRDLIVGTMCHCDDPDECDDHWQFFTNATMGHSGDDHVARGRTLNEAQMRAIAALVAFTVEGIG